jgi:PAS domain S-box-containing protein
VTARRPPQIRLALGALVLLIAIVALLGTSQVLTARNSQRKQVHNGELTAAHLASSALSSALASRLQLISNLAAQPQFAPVFTSPHPKQDVTLASELHLLYPGFASFDLVSASGRLLARWPAAPTTAGKDVSSSSFFTGVTRTHRPYISAAIQQSAPPSELVVGLAAPVTDASKNIVGVLQATLSARSIGSVIGGTDLRGGGQLVIVDQSGHLLTGPAAGALHSFTGLAPVHQALAGRTGTADTTLPGYSGTRLMGYAPVPGIGWAVVAESPQSALTGPLSALTERLVAIGLVVLLLALGTALLVAGLLRRLNREHDQAGALLASVGEGVATLSPSGETMLVSPALASLLGRPGEELVGQPWSTAVTLYDHHGSRIEWDDSIPHRAIRERSVVASAGYDLVIGRSDGYRVPVALTASPLLAGGELLGAVIVVRDVSHEREVDQLKSSLVSTVSHELRTPLTMIQGFSELLLERDNIGVTQSREALQQIHGSSIRLGRLIDDLLSVSRIDSGKLTADITAVDLRAVIAEATAGIVSEQPSRVSVDVEAGLPDLLADYDKTLQIMTNLVSNAAKYSPDTTTIEIRARSKGNHAEVSVVDHGIGLSTTETVEIFEKFTRADRAEVRQVAGTGLGLYITKSLVELMHGQLWVTSTPDEGSTFSFTLPLTPNHASQNASAHQRTTHAETADR